MIKNYSLQWVGGIRDRDRMVLVVGFITTYAISAYLFVDKIEGGVYCGLPVKDV